MKQLAAIIRNLERCATQNEADARTPGGDFSSDCDEARAVAGEQRRMLRILRRLQTLSRAMKASDVK
jgi:hypothetical protein